jgi:hypothetical protein
VAFVTWGWYGLRVVWQNLHLGGGFRDGVFSPGIHFRRLEDRFVWFGMRLDLGQFPELVEGLESALTHSLEPGFVAIEELELIAGPERGEGVGGLARKSVRRAAVDSLVVEGRFNGPEAAKAPRGGDDFLDNGIFGSIDRVEFLQVLIEELAKDAGGFDLEDYSFCQQAVAEGIGGRAASSSI